MNPTRRHAMVRWFLVGALLACVFCAAHGALLIYFMQSTGNLAVFQPPRAEDVSRQAAPFQNNTGQTDGMFRMIQEQHRHLGLMFSRLETADQLSWSLAVEGTLIFSLLSGILAACLWFLRGSRNGLVPGFTITPT